MRILVVNAFQVDEEGVKSIIEFEEMVREQIKNQKGLVDTETEICLKDKDSLDDILYEPESGFLNRNAAMAFDTYDMIFLSGSAHILPWNKSVSKVLFCKKNKKLCLFFLLDFPICSLWCFFACAFEPKKCYLHVVSGLRLSALFALQIS
jgi:hypothetical protein